MTLLLEKTESKPISLLPSEIHLMNSRSYYSPGCYTIDEMLLPFWGRCAFRMYIPNKPVNYAGAEINVLPTKNKLLNPTKVVLRLTECIEGSMRDITGGLLVYLHRTPQ